MTGPLASVPAVDWAALAPVLAPSLALLAVLVADALRRRPQQEPSPTARRLLDALALAGLLAAGAAVVWLARDLAATGSVRSTICVPGAGDGLGPRCSWTVSGLTLTLQALLVLAGLGALLLALDGQGAKDRATHHALLLAAVTGGVALAGARDLVSFVVALETASLPAVALVALRRDARGAQGALTLLLTSVTSLGLLLLGIALLLLTTGSLHLHQVAATLAQPGLPAPVRALAALGVVLAAAGIFFKLSAVPFHGWTPDTYAGAPLPVAAFLAVVSKLAAVAALLILVGVGAPGLAGVWAPVIGTIGAVSVTVGNLVALRQQVAVRLLAWSTVAQSGWVLLPLAAAGQGARPAVRAASAGSLGYALAYAAASLTAFTVVVLFGRRHPAGEGHTLLDYRGLARQQPVAAACLAFALACLAGLPPGVMGLVAKVVAVRPLVQAGIWPLALVAAVNVVLGLLYYLRWAALMVGPSAAEVTPRWRISPAEGTVLAAGTGVCVGLSIWPQLVAGVLPGLLR